MTVISEESWEPAFGAVKEQFEISNLLPEQENLLRELLLGKNIFVELFPSLNEQNSFVTLFYITTA